jgi:hypothetical protein
MDQLQNEVEEQLKGWKKEERQKQSQMGQIEENIYKKKKAQKRRKINIQKTKRSNL